jgi:hypothetical protein
MNVRFEGNNRRDAECHRCAGQTVPLFLSQTSGQDLINALVVRPSGELSIDPRLVVEAVVQRAPSNTGELVGDPLGKRTAAAAYRRDIDAQLKQAIAAPISTMVSAVNSYLGTANAVLSGQSSPTSLVNSYETAFK